jgi:hypothetical protein
MLEWRVTWAPRQPCNGFFKKGEGKDPFRSVVTYGLHYITKDDIEQNIPLSGRPNVRESH